MRGSDRAARAGLPWPAGMTTKSLVLDPHLDSCPLRVSGWLRALLCPTSV
jgi:hypothetical protein